jgi:hypothetical protein
MWFRSFPHNNQYISKIASISLLFKTFRCILSLPPAIHSYTLICIVFPTSFWFKCYGDDVRNGSRKIYIFIIPLPHFISSFKANNPFNSPLMNTGVSKTENMLFENNQYIIRLLYHSNKRQKLIWSLFLLLKVFWKWFFVISRLFENVRLLKSKVVDKRFYLQNNSNNSLCLHQSF